MISIIFDLETTGLPLTKGWNQYYSYMELDKYENARIVQIAYMCIDDNYEIISEKQFMFPDIDLRDSEKIHGISREYLNKNGVLFEDVIDEIYNDLKDCDNLIAHNINFDINILSSELYRRGHVSFASMIRKKKLICSMILLKDVVGIKNKYGIKYPTLTELYKYVFGQDKEIENCHNAKYDVLALYECIKNLRFYKNLDIIKIIK